MSEKGGPSDRLRDSGREGRPTGDGTAVDSDAAVSTEDLLRMLADRRRRHVLRYLSTTHAAAVSDLVNHVQTVIDRSTVDAESVAIDLVHVQLPALADSDLVEYNRRSKTVRYCRHPGVERYLAETREEDY